MLLSVLSAFSFPFPFSLFLAFSFSYSFSLSRFLAHTHPHVQNPHETKYLLKQILQKCCGLKRKLSEYTSATLNALIPLSAAGDNGASAAAVGSGSAISPETIPEDIAEKGGGGGGGPAAKRRAP